MSRIALVLEHRGNLDLLREWLQKEHEIVVVRSGEGLPGRIDLCIIDLASLASYEGELERARASEAPVFLPVLLITAARGVDQLVRSGASGRVDEFISIPVAKAELDARLRVLLRSRSQSLQLMDRLLDAQRMEAVGVLAGGVVHDLNNFLTVIQMSTSLLAEELQESRLQPEGVEQIRTAVGRASDLTRRLLTFSRKEPSQDEFVNLNDVLSTTAKILEATLAKDLEFVLELDRELSAVQCDPVRLEQVLMNLIVNAVDVLPDGGRITATTANVGPETPAVDVPTSGQMASTSWVRVTVTDTGPGIEEEVLARIFDPFFTTKASGTGLGLASTARIIADMGGSIDVATEIGAGTTFRVLIPGADVPLPADERDTQVDPMQRTLEDQKPAYETLAGAPGRTILVVDDEHDILKIVSRILHGAGYSVLEASTAGDAVALIRKPEYGVEGVITDSIIPGMSRSDLGEVLNRAAGRQIPVAFMSGYEREELTERIGSLGAAPFLQKPFSPEQLVQTVRSLFEAES